MADGPPPGGAPGFPQGQPQGPGFQGSLPPTPGGWYPDPAQPGLLRWFDGRQWTLYTQYTQPSGPPGPSPTDDLDGVRRFVPWAKVGIWVLALSGPIVAFLYSFIFHSFFRSVQNSIQNPNNPPSTPFGGGLGGILLLDLFGLIALGAEIGLMIWMFKSASLARNLHMPMTLDNYWAILGWLIPIVNFWFPYRMVTGMVPLGHPVRTKALHWWVVYIVGAVGFGVLGIVLAFLPSVARLVVLPLLLVSWYEATQGTAMVDGILEVHRSAVKALVPGTAV